MTGPSRVGIIDYGLGNLFSVQRAVQAAGGEPVVLGSADGINGMQRLIVPGVGAFGDGMAGLRARSLEEPLREYVASGRPVLGICLGMQLLMEQGTEFGVHEGLRFVPGRVDVIPAAGEGLRYKVPHVGWTPVDPAARAWDGTLLAGISPGTEFYFVHSYRVLTRHPDDALAESTYGGHRFCSVVARGNILGTQFHPEKSGPAGLALLRNFLSLP